MTFRGIPDRHTAYVEFRGRQENVTCRVCGRGMQHIVHTDGTQAFECPDNVFHQIGPKRQIPENYALSCCKAAS